MLEALKEGANKALASAARDKIADFARVLPAEWLTDSLGEMIGPFGGAIAVALLRHIFNIKDKLTRVEERLTLLQIAIGRVDKKLERMIAAPLDAAKRDLEILAELKSPRPGEEKFFDGRVQSIIDNLSTYRTYLVTRPSDAAKDSVLTGGQAIDLLLGFVVEGFGGWRRVASAYWAPLVPSLIASRLSLDEELLRIPGELENIEDELAAGKSDLTRALEADSGGDTRDTMRLRVFLANQADSRIKSAERARLELEARRASVIRRLNMANGLLSVLQKRLA